MMTPRFRAGGVGCLLSLLCFATGCDPGGGVLIGDTLIAPGNGEDRVRSAFTTKATQIVYVNFEGVRIDDCSNYCSDAHTNRSWVIKEIFNTAYVEFSPYSSAEGREVVLQVLASAFDPYNVSFTTSRPAGPPYSMVVVSTSQGPHHGVAPLDCGNSNLNDIAFVYSIGSASATWIGKAAAHELGHTFGLSHVTSTADVMHWASKGQAFTKATYDAAHPSGKCFSGNVQDAPELLRAALGEPPFNGTFTDDDGSSHEAAIEAIYKAGLTHGCAGGDRPKYCPNDAVTRGQMAAFLVRALNLPPASTNYFSDDDGTWYEASANALAQAQITTGCAPGKFCGSETVTRGQTAAFLDRAFKYADTAVDFFDDDNGTFYEPHANRLAAAKITKGCGYRAYCGASPVTRAQMATFLARCLKLI